MLYYLNYILIVKKNLINILYFICSIFILLECQQCGAFFELRDGQRNRFCSMKCCKKYSYYKRKNEGYKYDQTESYANRKYGISGEMYKNFKSIFELQGCAICGGKEEFNLDHCHSTGNIRGFLCRSCNLGLGHFFDNPKLLENAITYLDKTNSGHSQKT